MGDYYVTKQGTNHSTVGGSVGSPWLSISYGVGRIGAGDTLHVSNGTYNEVVTISKQGSAGSEITIKAKSGQTAVYLDGKESGVFNGLPSGEQTGKVGLNDMGTSWGGLLQIVGPAKYIVWDGIHVTGSLGRGVKVYNNASHITIKNCRIYNHRSSCFLAYLANNVLIDNCDIYEAGMFLPRLNRVTTVWQDHPGGVSFHGSHYVTIKNSIVHNIWGEGIIFDSNVAKSSNITVEDNIVYDCMDVAIYLHAANNCVIQRNFCYQSTTNLSAWDTVEGHKAYWSGICVVPLEPQYSDPDNVHYMPVTIPTEDFKIISNIVSNIRYGDGIRLGGNAFYSGAVNRALIANNTVSHCMIGIQPICVHKNNLIFKNNIITACDTDFAYTGVSATNQAWSFSNNYYDTPPPVFAHSSSDKYGNRDGSIALINATHGAVAGAGDPSKFAIGPTSSGINAGVDLTAAHGTYPEGDVKDYWGATRSVWDIGAVELSGTPPVVVPVAPSSLSATPVGVDRIDLRWIDNSDNETSFNIERSYTGAPGTFTKIRTQVPDTTFYSNGGLLPDSDFWYRVNAENSAGVSPWSNVATAITDSAQVPPIAPSGLVATKSATTPDSRINLSWTDNSTDETQFNIERSLDGVVFSPLITVVANTVYYPNKDGLVENTDYWYRVNSENDAGVSGWSNVATAKTDLSLSAPVAPSSLIGTAVAADQIELRWTDNSDNEISFNIERSSSGAPGTFTLLQTLIADTTFHSNGGLVANTIYYYRVNSENAIGISAWSNVVTVRTDKSTQQPIPGPVLHEPTNRKEVYVLDRSLKVVGIIEDYYSLIWAERYYEAGDFELELPIFYNESRLIAFGNFLVINDSDVLMIIEEIKPATSEEKSSLMVKGESAESLLKRRSISVPEDVNGPTVLVIANFINENVINPTDSKRKISILHGVAMGSIPGDYQDQVEVQSIYDIVVKICKATGVGFEVYRGSSGNYLYCRLYVGQDRSYEQSTNLYVVFSPNFDNVISSSFYLSEKGRITVVNVITDDPVYPYTTVWMGDTVGEIIPEPEDLDRREVTLETSIKRDLDNTTQLTNSEVSAIIQTRGREIILENRPKGLFEGDFDIQGNFKLGIDFNMGDVVQTSIEGRTTPARVIELVRTYSVEGNKTYIAMDFIDVTNYIV